VSTTIRVRVPGTTANLGPGFDALGLAVGVFNTVVAAPSDALSVAVSGEGAQDLPRDASNLLVRCIERACREGGRAMPPLSLACVHEIPTSRGLGSSAAAVIAGLLVGDALLDRSLGREKLLALATEIEGHPDNAAPALFGGLQAAVHADGGAVHRVTVPVREFPRVALFVPDFPMPTREARAVLPATLTRAQAVFNIARSSLLVAALAAGAHEALAVATEDALHQRPREAIFPAMPALFRAVLARGALGVWLSGAGSTVAAFARDEAGAARVADAMARAASEHGLTGRARVVAVDTGGATVERAG
jgi:homoserine kinase